MRTKNANGRDSENRNEGNVKRLVPLIFSLLRIVLVAMMNLRSSTWCALFQRKTLTFLQLAGQIDLNRQSDLMAAFEEML